MKYLHRLLAVASAAFFIAGSALAQNPGTVTNHAFAIGKGPGQAGYSSLLCGSAQLAVGQAAADPICRTVTGDVTISAAGVTAIGAAKVTSAMLNSNVYSTAHTWAGQQTFVAPILGTPASGTASNLTDLPISTGVSGLGTGVATFLATPSAANLAAAVTGETGTGALVFATSPNITTPTGIVKNDVGLGSVDNTSDVGKPVSTATQTALNLKPNIGTQADQETGTSNTAAVTPGRQQYHRSAPKAWAYYTVSGTTYTLVAGYNVASLNRTGAGDVTITLTTAFSSSIFAAIASSDSVSQIVSAFPVSASTLTVRIRTAAGVGSDAGFSVMAFGDQ